MSEPVIAGAALAFEVLSSGISAMQAGDVQYVGPTSPIGVTATNIPSNVRLQAQTHSTEIVTVQESGAVEHVNVTLLCWVQYDGPQVQATFQFTDQRSRLMRDTHIRIENPLQLERRQASDTWVQLGINEYPVVRVPVTVYVDRPFPLSNYHESFMLVLNGMTGFGTPNGGEVYEGYQQWWD